MASRWASSARGPRARPPSLEEDPEWRAILAPVYGVDEDAVPVLALCGAPWTDLLGLHLPAWVLDVQWGGVGGSCRMGGCPPGLVWIWVPVCQVLSPASSPSRVVRLPGRPLFQGAPARARPVHRHCRALGVRCLLVRCSRCGRLGQGLGGSAEFLGRADPWSACRGRPGRAPSDGHNHSEHRRAPSCTWCGRAAGHL